VKPGRHLRLRTTTFEHARELVRRVEMYIEGIHELVDGKSKEAPSLDLELPPSGLAEGTSNGIIKRIPAEGERFQAVYRQVGCLSLFARVFSADTVHPGWRLLPSR